MRLCLDFNPGCVTLGQLLNLSVLFFTLLECGDSNVPARESWRKGQLGKRVTRRAEDDDADEVNAA